MQYVCNRLYSETPSSAVPQIAKIDRARAIRNLLLNWDARLSEQLKLL